MDPREMETLVQRLVQNPHDQETIHLAHQSGQTDPKSYAMLLEKVGTATSDPAFACHWLTEAANVWSTTLGDAHRAARALMIAIDRDPTQATPADRLAELYREKGDTKALVALLERRAKALTLLLPQEPELRGQVASLHEELGQLWQNPPLSQAKKALESYRRAIEFDAGSQYSIYAIRELYKASGQWREAVPYFELEQALVDDRERKIALYQDEGDVRKNALDFTGSASAYRRARALEGGQDATLKQQLGSVVLERIQAGQSVAFEELREAAQLFVELAEQYPGEHGLSYAQCALELLPGDDRAVQLAMYYADQLGRQTEVAPRAAAYLKASPEGALATEARKLIAESMIAGGDEALLDALAPPPDADAEARVQALLEMAQALARKAKKADAAARFHEVLAIEPANLDAIGFLEPFLRQSRKYQELRDVLFAAGSDENAETSLRQGWLREVATLCETQLKDVDGAIAALKELLVLDPDDEPAQSQLKRLLEKHERWDDLALVLTLEAEQTPDVETRISLEKSLAKLHEQRRNDPVKSGEAWARIAALATGDDAAIGTAVRHFEQGQRRDLAMAVIADNVAGVADNSLRAPLLRKLAELREAGGETLPAAEAFAEAATLLEDAVLWAAAERCFAAAEAWDQAATAADERARLSPVASEKAALYATEAGYLLRAGDESSSVLRLEQATELEPASDEYAAELEQRYRSAERNQELAAFLVRRAGKLVDRGRRSELRKRAAELQRVTLGDPEAARQTLLELLADGDDLEALNTLADDSEQRSEFGEAVALLERVEAATKEPGEQVPVLMRQARIVADGLDDPRRAIVIYERVLKDFDPKHDEALARIAELYERLDEPKGVASTLERRLLVLEDSAEKLKVADALARLYEEKLDDPLAAVIALDLVRELEPENFDAVARLSMLCEKLEDWPRVAKHISELIEVEGDEQELSRMTRRLAEILHEKVHKSDEALAALMQMADAGDEPCREEYVRLGDALGWKGVVASKLVEWYAEMPVSPARSAALRGAFDRFVAVGREADAANVAKELARTRSASPEIAQELERIAVKLKDLDALSIAHELMLADLSGPARAEQMVRQAEVLIEAGVDSAEAINHGEQALTSVPAAEVEPLLDRLSKLTDSASRIVDIYERQVSRCKSPSDKFAALGRATSIAARHGDFARARRFFDLALGGAVQEEMLNTLLTVARSSDAQQNTDQLRRTLAEALANGGQGSRDGGRTRSMLLGRAAELAHRELRDTEQAFAWLGDAIVTHVDDDSLSALERLADEVGEPRRAEAVLSRALEEVFDGPLVRKLLARRATLRRDKLSEAAGAAADLKRLHDLSPADATVMDELSQLYVQLQDYRGMVQLYEDQILRGKESSTRAELARKVALLWEEKLFDPREAADAWRRVLRMKAGDPEAVAGLERAKANMLKRPASDSGAESELAASIESGPAVAVQTESEAEPSSTSQLQSELTTAPETELAASSELESNRASEPSPPPAAEIATASVAPDTEKVPHEDQPDAPLENFSEPAPESGAATASPAPEPAPELAGPAIEPPGVEATSESLPTSFEANAELATDVDSSADKPSSPAEPELESAQAAKASTAQTPSFPEPAPEARVSAPAPSRPRPTPPPLPPSAIPTPFSVPPPLNGGVASALASEEPSVPPAPAHRAPPPKPSRRAEQPPVPQAPAVRPPPPPPRSSAASPTRPPAPPAMPVGRLAPPAPPSAEAQGGVQTAELPAPPPPAVTADDDDELTVDDDELTVDEDELIDDRS